MSSTILITGASTGIGEACARYLAQRGNHVYAGVRKQADAERLQASIPANLTPVFIDVTDTETIDEAVKTITKAVGDAGLNALVNNAGIAVTAPLEFVPLADVERQLAINVTGQIAVTQAFLPLIRKAQGRIINMGSIGGRSALPFVGAYNASKFALEAITDTLRLELRPWGIRVMIIEPGTIATSIWDKGVSEVDDVMAQFPLEAQDLYGGAMKRMRRFFAGAGRSGIPAEQVAEAVDHAIHATRPKNRYVVGSDARQRVWLERLPDRLRDWLIARTFKLDG